MLCGVVKLNCKKFLFFLLKVGLWFIVICVFFLICLVNFLCGMLVFEKFIQFKQVVFIGIDVSSGILVIVVFRSWWLLFRQVIRVFIYFVFLGVQVVLVIQRLKLLGLRLSVVMWFVNFVWRFGLGMIMLLEWLLVILKVLVVVVIIIKWFMIEGLINVMGVCFMSGKIRLWWILLLIKIRLWCLVKLVMFCNFLCVQICLSGLCGEQRISMVLCFFICVFYVLKFILQWLLLLVNLYFIILWFVVVIMWVKVWQIGVIRMMLFPGLEKVLM